MTFGATEVHRDFVAVRGPDAMSFLQGQLSQDVAALAVGMSAPSFVLAPTGKVDAWVRATRTAEEEVVLDLDGGWGEALVTRLSRFKLRVKVDLEPLAWQCVAVRGPGAAGVAVAGPGVLALPAWWPGVEGVDLVGPGAAVPEGVGPMSAEEYEALRIRAGVPRMGAELDERTIPAEAGVVERSVSFTKGCFTGQELVARIDSRGGNVPRRLRLVVLTGGAAPGEPLLVGDKVVGALTSVANTPERTVALGYVGRAVEPPADATVAGRPVRIEALPPG